MSKNQLDDLKSDVKRRSDYYVSVFERKKSANDLSKTSIRTTGSIDTSKLYKYQYDEKIFLSYEEKPVGQSHGVVLLIDFSGSMREIIQDVLLRAYTIVVMCRKLNIPYCVYGFSSQQRKTTSTIYQIFHSSMNRKTEQETFEMIMKYPIGDGDMFGNIHMGSTPLIESLVKIKSRIELHKKTWNVDKMIFMLLSDGLDNSSCNHAVVHYTDTGIYNFSEKYDDGYIGEYDKVLNCFYIIKRELGFCDILWYHLSSQVKMIIDSFHNRGIKRNKVIDTEKGIAYSHSEDYIDFLAIQSTYALDKVEKSLFRYMIEKVA